VVAALAVGGVLLAVMIATSGYAAVTLPASARIPLHLGSHQHVYLVSKRAGLVIWPAAGAVLYGILGGVSASSLASDWVPGVRDVLMPAVMVVVLGFQAGALVLARQDQGSRSGGVTRAAGGGGGGAGTTARSD
jgi:hypothetical protein